MRPHLAAFALVLLAPVGCLGKVEPEPSLCPGVLPTCVTPSVSCAMATTAEAICSDRAWRCPTGSREYQRAPAAAASCEPFSSDGSPFTALGGSLARVPIDGGRCLWVAETATTVEGASLRNVGLVADAGGTFGACPTTSTFADGILTPVVDVEGNDDAGILVQIDGGFVDAGETKVLYRLFQTDPGATYGVTLLGGGFGRWNAAAQRIEVPGASALQWDPSIDPGDASLVVSGTPYIWGCHAPPSFLSNPCAVARLAGGELQFLTTDDAWQADADVAETRTVFTSGPWISSVLAASAGLLHVYASSFGTTLETHVAASVTGPWTNGATLTSCDLPSADPKAYCAGPVVHEELMDPTKPGELVVSYGVGTTGTSPTRVTGTLSTAYWTRMTWATAN